MSRSSRAQLAAGLALTAVLHGLLSPIAHAQPAAPIEPITAPILDLILTTTDVTGTTRVEEQPRRLDVTFSAEVLFAKNSARLRPAARSRIREIAGQLRSRGPGQVSVVGYTDDLGSAAYGLALSRRRAQAVAGALRPLLAARDYPFRVTGRGEADPEVPNDSEANRRINRRVELTWIGPG